MGNYFRVMEEVSRARFEIHTRGDNDDDYDEESEGDDKEEDVESGVEFVE